MARRLLTLNGLATVCVVLYHASGWGFVAMFWWTHRYQLVAVPNFDQMYSLAYYGLRWVEQVVSFAIPGFLFVSGFFAAMAASRGDRREVWRGVGKRTLNLVIPYLLWSMIMLAIDLAQGASFSPFQVIRILLTGQAASPFYFVPLLCQLYLLSPLLVGWVKTHPIRLLVGAATAQLAVQALQYGRILGLGVPDTGWARIATSGWFFIGSILWFCLGMVASSHPTAVSSEARRGRWIWIAGIVILIPLGMWEWEALLQASGESWLDPQSTLLDGLYALAVLMSFVAFSEARMPLDRRLNELGPRSFGVYLVHSLVLLVLARGVYHVAPAILGAPLVFQTILVVGGLGGPLLLMAGVRRSPLRSAYRVLFG